MNTIISTVIILIAILVMSIISHKTLKGIQDALERNRQQLEQLLLAHERQSVELAKLVADFSAVQLDLKLAIDALKSPSSPQPEVITPSPVRKKKTQETPYSSIVIENGQEPISQDEQPHTLTFFAKAYEYPDRLVVEAKNYDDAASTVPFKVETKNNKGKISFNTACYAQVASNVNVLVFPFCDVNRLSTGTPQGIENSTAGEVALINGEWVITKKPIIKII